jgi:hypothetical protein
MKTFFFILLTIYVYHRMFHCPNEESLMSVIFPPRTSYLHRNSFGNMSTNVMHVGEGLVIDWINGNAIISFNRSKDPIISTQNLNETMEKSPVYWSSNPFLDPIISP